MLKGLANWFDGTLCGKWTYVQFCQQEPEWKIETIIPSDWGRTHIPLTFSKTLDSISAFNSGRSFTYLDNREDSVICMSRYFRMSSSVAWIFIVWASGKNRSKLICGREVIIRLTVFPSLTRYLSRRFRWFSGYSSRASTTKYSFECSPMADCKMPNTSSTDGLVCVWQWCL